MRYFVKVCLRYFEREQCDQIGQILKVPSHNISYNSGSNIFGNFLGYFQQC